jgi:hypothetical protein
MQTHDCTQAIPLIGDRRPEAVLADKGYDTDPILNHLQQRGITAAIQWNLRGVVGIKKMGQTIIHTYMKPLLARIENGQIDPTYIISHRITLDKASEMYRAYAPHIQSNCETRLSSMCRKIVTSSSRPSIEIIERELSMRPVEALTSDTVRWGLPPDLCGHHPADLMLSN